MKNTFIPFQKIGFTQSKILTPLILENLFHLFQKTFTYFKVSVKNNFTRFKHRLTHFIK